ncbi:NADPH-dependent F420 reductase [Arthrobacter sp. SA17]
MDTSNYYPGMNGHIEAVIDGQVESLWSQEQLGRPVVKAWNAALAETQRTMAKPAGSPDRIAIPVAGDSTEARATVMRLVDDSGFDAYDAGPSPNRGASSPAPRPTALSWVSRTSVRLSPPRKRTKRRADATA